jgi:alpha-glucoside transport system permease protein
VWLAHTGYGLPFQVYLLRNAMGGLPREVFESAEIDGASHVAKFWQIAVPMSVPAIASLVIFVFLGVWNDLLVALTYMGSSPNRPLTVVVTQLVTSFGGGWQFLTAAAVLQMSLPLVVFLALQRYFVRGITSGSVKG